MPKKSIYDNPHIYKKYMHIILEFLPTPNTQQGSLSASVSKYLNGECIYDSYSCQDFGKEQIRFSILDLPGCVVLDKVPNFSKVHLPPGQETESPLVYTPLLREWLWQTPPSVLVTWCWCCGRTGWRVVHSPPDLPSSREAHVVVRMDGHHVTVFQGETLPSPCLPNHCSSSQGLWDSCLLCLEKIQSDHGSELLRGVAGKILRLGPCAESGACSSSF